MPRPAAVGAAGPLAITAVAVDRTVTPWRARVEALAPPDAELFVEGPTVDWALPVPAPATVAGEGRARFEFDHRRRARRHRRSKDARLTLTLVSKAGAIETTVRPGLSARAALIATLA